MKVSCKNGLYHFYPPPRIVEKKFAGPWPTGVLEKQFWLFMVNPPIPPREALRPATPTLKDWNGSFDMLWQLPQQAS